MKLGGAMIPPNGPEAAYASSVQSGLSSPMPSANRRMASRVAYSLLTQASVRNSVPISSRIWASISSVNLPVASSLPIPVSCGVSVVVIAVPQVLSSVVGVRPYQALSSRSCTSWASGTRGPAVIAQSSIAWAAASASDSLATPMS